MLRVCGLSSQRKDRRAARTVCTVLLNVSGLGSLRWRGLADMERSIQLARMAWRTQCALTDSTAWSGCSVADMVGV